MATTSAGETRSGGWPPGAPRYWARAPRDVDDLEIDFQAPRPHVITQILARCVTDAAGRPWHAPDVWQWTVPQRTQALLAVARAAEIPAVTALAQCVLESCGERIELEFELESFAAPAESGTCTVQRDSAQVRLRLPTGEDQRRWLECAPSDSSVLPGWMAAHLVSEIDGAAPDPIWQVPETWIADFEDALAENDPTTDLVVSVSCTRCGGTLAVEVDLEALLIERLARMQQALLHDVHLFASRYHWSEAQVLQVPAWRRARYLAMLRAQD